MDKRAALLIAILLSILHAVLAITASMQKSPTFDEPTHVTAGYSYWLTNDFRLDPENGSLPSRWAALPLLAMRPNFPLDSNAWKHSDEGEVSRKFFYRCGNDADAMLMRARVMNAVLSAAICLLVFLCARELFGTLGAFISEALAVFDPNLLAHGGLATSDTAAALLFLAAVWIYWRLLRRLTICSLAICSLAVAGLFLAKMSAALFIVIALILALARVVSAEPLTIAIRNFTRSVQDRQWKAATFVGSTIAIGAVVFIAIWAAFAFRFTAVASDTPARKVWDNCWSRLLADQTSTQNTIAFARDHRLLPEAYLLGLAYTLKTAQTRPAFLDGKWSDFGFRSFFPRTFLYKTPLSFFVLIVLACAAACTRWRDQRATFVRDVFRIAPLLALVVVYGGIALTTKLNIGHRHLLPVYPPLFVLCGMCAWWLRSIHRRAVAYLIGVAIFAAATESIACHPNYLAYFNPVAGGSAGGYKHLVDSSLDWGQDLPTLNDWLRENVGARAPIYLAYFGTAEPQWYGVRAINLPHKTSDTSPLRPGLYCISATLLQRVYGPERGQWNASYEATYRQALEWRENYRKIDNSPAASLDEPRTEVFQRLEFARLCAYLRHREPNAQIGYSILVFVVSDATLREALLGAPPE